MADQGNKKSDHHLHIPESWPSKKSLLSPLGPPPPLPQLHLWTRLYGHVAPSDGKSVAKSNAREEFEKNIMTMETRYAAMQGDALQGIELQRGSQTDIDIDSQRLKRVYLNRLSAQKSRMRKLQYMAYLENKVKELETVISELYPQITSLTKQKERLLQEKQFINQQLNAHDETTKLKEAEIMLNRAEVKRLRELHLNQLQMTWQLANLNMIQSVGQQQFGCVNPIEVPFAAGMGTQLAPNNMMEEKMSDDSFSLTGSREFF